MYARVLNAEEKRNITQIRKAIEKPRFKLSDKAKQKLMGAFAVVSSISKYPIITALPVKASGGTSGIKRILSLPYLNI